MPKKKRTIRKEADPDEAASPTDLPDAERVPKDKVGEVVEDFSTFGGAKAVEAHEESNGTWLVTATA